MIKKLIQQRILAAFALILVFAGCSRYGDDVTTSETDTVVTIRDEETNFSSMTKTFAIVDKINIADDANDQIDSTVFWNRYNDPILKAIVDNLTALGYTEVDDSENPALFINVTVNVNVTAGAYYPGWWWGYYPCYPYYYWWCYGGWYPGGAYYYSFTEGSIAIEMVDISRSEGNERPTIIWLAGLTGVLYDNPTTAERAIKGIDQAFKQSPYLR
jgi:hypothetical protein